MSAPRRLLLISYAFPPVKQAEAMLAAKRMAALGGWEVDVVSTEPFPPTVEADHSLDEYVEARFADVERIPMPAWTRRRSVQRLPLVWRIPDELRILNPRLRRVVGRRGLDRYAAVVSWSQWHSVHLAARRLRLGGGPPWIAHLSDPWAKNPYLRPRRLEIAVNRRLERSVLTAADRIALTSPEAVEFVLGPYPDEVRSRVRVLPHAFDPGLYPATRPDSGDRIRLLYVGSFYGPRTPEPLFRGLELLVRRRGDLAAAIGVDLVGTIDPRMLESESHRRLPPGLVRVREPVDYLRSLRLMSGADVLLVVDAPLSRSPFLPSKLVDYLGAGRPVVSVSPPGPARRLTEEVGGWSADPGSPDATAEALEAAIEWARRHSGEKFGRPEVRASYENRVVAGRLAEVLDEIT